MRRTFVLVEVSKSAKRRRFFPKRFRWNSAGFPEALGFWEPHAVRGVGTKVFSFGYTQGISVSDTDSFIEEVAEEVRRDRLYHYMRRYGWIAVLVVLGIVGTSAYIEWQRSSAMNSARDTGDAILAALENDDQAARVAALGTISVENPEAQAIVSLIAANQAEAAGDTDAAITQLEAIAANAVLPTEYRQMATLKSLMLRGSALALDERKLGYEALTTPGMPYRLLALEQLALIAVEEGQIDAAVTQLEALRNDSEASSGLRTRAAQLIVALGYEPQEVNELPVGSGN